MLHRRSASSRSKFLAFYELNYKGQPLKFNLSLNNHLLAPGFVSERRYGGIASAKIQSHAYNSCHMIGEVRSRALAGGLAALSTCDGLVSTQLFHHEGSRGSRVTPFFPLESDDKTPLDRVRIPSGGFDGAVDELTVNFPRIPVVWEFSGSVSKFPKGAVLCRLRLLRVSVGLRVTHPGRRCWEPGGVHGNAACVR